MERMINQPASNKEQEREIQLPAFRHTPDLVGRLLKREPQMICTRPQLMYETYTVHSLSNARAMQFGEFDKIVIGLVV